MDEVHRRNHLFESGEGSGVLVYIIDDNEPVCLKFSSLVKIEVLFDSFDNWSKSSVDGFKIDHAESVLIKGEVTESVGDNDGFVSVDGAHEHKSPGHGDIKTSDVNIESNLENKGQASSSKENKLRVRRSKRSKPADELDNSELPKRFHRHSAAQSSGYKSRSTKEEKNRRDSEDGDESAQEIDFMGSNTEDNSKSDHHVTVYSKKLRSSQRVNKLNVRLQTAFKASKAIRTLLKSKIRVNTTKPKKYLAKQTRNPDMKSHNEDFGLQVKERTRKLLIDKTIKCEYCAVEFKNQQAFYDHRRADESTHKCGICGKVEPYEAHLIVHMQKHRRVKEEAASKNSDKPKNPSTELPAESASVQFSNKKKSKKEKMKCNICGLVVSSMDSLKIHTFLHTGEYAYRCCVCGENFSSLSSRQHHMDVHVSAQRFKCNPCGERFTSRAELAKHQLTHEIKCALCGEIFPNKTSRTCHFRVSHPNDILKCSLCSNLFASMEDLEKHLAYHKKGKKEQCPVCGIVVSKLKDHMLMHSQIAQEKLYACDQCPMRYLRKSNLDRHMRTHTGEKPYACNKCPKSFRSNGMLRKHLLTHTKERPYQCEVCGKQCSLRSNLNTHMRVHNSDRHFSCIFCSQSFNHKNSLHGHMKNKHAQEMNMQERQLKVSAHPPHQPPISAPNIVPEINKNVPFSDKHFQNLDMPVGKPQNLDSDYLKMEKVISHQGYSQMYSQMDFASNMPGSMTTSLLMESDRIALNKYDIHTQINHAHGYLSQPL